MDISTRSTARNLLDGGLRLRISCSTQAGQYSSGTGAYVEASEFMTTPCINIAALLPPHYYEYIGPIWAEITSDGRGITVTSRGRSATISYPASPNFNAGEYGLSYATCEVSIFLASY